MNSKPLPDLSTILPLSDKQLDAVGDIVGYFQDKREKKAAEFVTPGQQTNSAAGMPLSDEAEQHLDFNASRKVTQVR